jgi:hypothetical protein
VPLDRARGHHQRFGDATIRQAARSMPPPPARGRSGEESPRPTAARVSVPSRWPPAPRQLPAPAGWSGHPPRRRRTPHPAPPLPPPAAARGSPVGTESSAR